MARRFTELAFSDGVRRVQEQYGSRLQGERLERSDRSMDELGEAEAAFIAARDGFYIATVGENGWPYVQFRGGPAGFLKVLDARTLAFADFRGNRQYITTGSLLGDGRAALILMDYANRRRLKIWARARIVDATADPTLVERLRMPDYEASIERSVVIAVEAFDWNCQQHITPRYTEAQVRQVIDDFRNRVAVLEAEVESLRAAGPAYLERVERGSGTLS